MGDSIDIISDEELVKQCLKDKRAYQERLYRKFADQMYNVALTYAKDEDNACDILQESFIKVFRNLDQFRFDSPLQGWIRRIVVNTALEFYRKEKRKGEVLEDVKYESNAPVVDHILSVISSREIVKMVNSLPEKAAMVLKLYSIEGYAHKEIAEMLDITVGTSKSQLNRARHLLKEEIKRNHG